MKIISRMFILKFILNTVLSTLNGVFALLNFPICIQLIEYYAILAVAVNASSYCNAVLMWINLVSNDMSVPAHGCEKLYFDCRIRNEFI